MPVAKKKKSKPIQESAGARLDEIASRGDQLANWIGENPIPVLVGAGAILLAAAIYGLSTSSSEGSAHAASTQIAATKSAFRQAMGGSYSGSLDVPEPANPEAARSTREEFLPRFQALGAEHAGSEMGSYALIQAGAIQTELDDIDGALASYGQALEAYDESVPMRGIVLERMALLHEQRGDAEAAIARHLEASGVIEYPLRYFALLNAARVQAESGQIDAAIASYDRIKTESPDLLIPEHTEATLMELKARRSR